MEAPRCRNAPQQDFGTERSAHLLDTFKPLANT